MAACGTAPPAPNVACRSAAARARLFVRPARWQVSQRRLVVWPDRCPGWRAPSGPKHPDRGDAGSDARAKDGARRPDCGSRDRHDVDRASRSLPQLASAPALLGASGRSFRGGDARPDCATARPHGPGPHGRAPVRRRPGRRARHAGDGRPRPRWRRGGPARRPARTRPHPRRWPRRMGDPAGRSSRAGRPRTLPAGACPGRRHGRRRGNRAAGGAGAARKRQLRRRLARPAARTERRVRPTARRRGFRPARHAAAPASTPGAAPRILQGGGAPAGDPGAAASGGAAAPRQQRLGLDMVDYDDAGSMRFAGSAAPGATVRVYVGPQMVGEATADTGGRWHLTPGNQPSVGRHTLRLDQIASADGSVAARIEVPFQRDRLSEEMVQDGRMVVQPGQNLWRIARHRLWPRRALHRDLRRQPRHHPRSEPDLPGPGLRRPGRPSAARRRTGALSPSALATPERNR